MAIFGKLFLGGIGALVGGPVGAILGTVIGHKLFDSGHAQTFSDQQRAQTIFFVNFISCLAKMAKADGRICEKEIKVIEEIFEKQLGLNAQGKHMAINIFNAAKEDSTPLESFIEQLISLPGYNQAMGTTLLSALGHVAMADGVLDPAEKDILLRAEKALRLPSGTVNRMMGQVDDIDEMYKILGCNANMSDQEIKKKHREKSLEYHPDKLVSKGLPEEFMKYANNEMVKINKAYDSIKKARGMH